MTEDDVRAIIADVLGTNSDRVGTLQFTGAVSQKMLGEAVAQAGEQSRFVLVDFSKVTRITGRKPHWR